MDWVSKGGYVLGIIFCCSVVALTVMIERGFFYHRVEKDINQAREKFNKSINKTGIGFSEKIAVKPDDFINQIFLIITRCGTDRNIMQNAVDDVLAKASVRMEKYLYILATIATISPLLGLLGTVLGMIKTFHAAALGGVGDPQALAEGISEALYNTAGGLIVTIPCIAAYNHFHTRAGQLMAMLERWTDGIISLTAAKGEKNAV